MNLSNINELPFEFKDIKNREIGLVIKDIVAGLRQGGYMAISARQALIELVNETETLQLAEFVESSITDHRTFLGNTMLLEQRINEVLSSPDIASMFITTDLVKFKEINDEYGQDYGDEVIKLAASALSSSIRKRPRPLKDSFFRIKKEDDIEYASEGYRIGGDEFAALLRDGDQLINANHENIVREKITRMLGDFSLKTYLGELGIESFGVRASYVIVDKKIHASYKDLLQEADPKLKTVCQYELQMNELGDFNIIKKL